MGVYYYLKNRCILKFLPNQLNITNGHFYVPVNASKINVIIQIDGLKLNGNTNRLQLFLDYWFLQEFPISCMAQVIVIKI